MEHFALSLLGLTKCLPMHVLRNLLRENTLPNRNRKLSESLVEMAPLLMLLTSKVKLWGIAIDRFSLETKIKTCKGTFNTA